MSFHVKAEISPSLIPVHKAINTITLKRLSEVLTYSSNRRCSSLVNTRISFFSAFGSAIYSAGLRCIISLIIACLNAVTNIVFIFFKVFTLKGFFVLGLISAAFLLKKSCNISRLNICKRSPPIAGVIWFSIIPL